ncbi:hypothetical protein, partial [Frankia sp. CiP3]|uniref:hypothetical protein n=1 Tax=Frankia sp. CiP3 TaxID=2880971 RepID=UPI001EF4E872
MSVVRDAALTVGAVAVGVMAAAEFDVFPVRTRRTVPTDALPATRHGWVYIADGMSGPRARRLRPATAQEAAASAASRAAGDGGWIGLGTDGQTYRIDDPHVIDHGGRYSATQQVDIVYVDNGERDASTQSTDGLTVYDDMAA